MGFRNLKNFPNMKLLAIFAVSALAQLEYDDMGNKKNNNKKPEKGPRWCENEANKLENSTDGTTIWKCRSRNPDNKNSHLTKRCKLKCKNGTSRSGNKKVYCKKVHSGHSERETPKLPP